MMASATAGPVSSSGGMLEGAVAAPPAADYKISRKVGKATTLPTAPAWSFGIKQDRTPREPGPGPGQYGYVVPWKKGTGFGSSTRYQRPNDQSPSPLDYRLDLNKTTAKSAPAYSLGGPRPKVSLRGAVPGPGQYEPTPAEKLVKPTPNAYSISARVASGKQAEQRPGPDAYDPDFKRKEVHGASLKFRHDIPPDNIDTPAPHDYTIQRPRSEGKTFGVSRSSIQVANGVPGPGSYAPDDSPVRPGRSAWSIGKSQRDPRSGLGGPGPGQYINEPIMSHQQGFSAASTSRSAPSYTFPGKPYASREPPTPAPIDYGLPNDPGLKSAPAFSVHGATPPDHKKNIPGPGTYNPRDDLLRHSAPAIQLHTKLGDPVLRDQKPAPGAYDPKLSRKPGVSLKFRHEILPDNADTPAPHDYAQFGPFGACCQTCGGTRGFTFARRYAVRPGEGVPGPQYHVGVSTLGVAAAVQVYKSQANRTVVL